MNGINLIGSSCVTEKKKLRRSQVQTRHLKLSHLEKKEDGKRIHLRELC